MRPILIATTRPRSTDDAGAMFNGERASAMSFARIVISIPPDEARKIGEIQWPASAPGNPHREEQQKDETIKDCGVTAIEQREEVLGRVCHEVSHGHVASQDVVPTIGFKLLYGFVILRLDRWAFYVPTRKNMPVRNEQQHRGAVKVAGIEKCRGLRKLNVI
jgi:hypothetical protein